MPESKKILVCVTPQQSGQTLIERSRQLADLHNAELQIVSVLPRHHSFYPDAKILERLQACAIEADAQMRVCFHDDPVESICAMVQEESFAAIVVGFPGKNSTDFVHRLHNRLPFMPINMVSKEGNMYGVELVPKKEAEAISSTLAQSL